MSDLVQSWCESNKRYVLIDTGKKGGIKDNSTEPFEGVPIKRKKPGAESEPVQASEPEPVQAKEPEPEPLQDVDQDNSRDSGRKKKGGFLGFFTS